MGLIVLIYALVFLMNYADKLRIKSIAEHERQLANIDCVMMKLDLTEKAYLLNGYWENKRVLDLRLELKNEKL